MSFICNQCHKEKPIENFYRDRNLKSGYRGRCKECVSLSDSRRVYANKPEEKRTCSICTIEKPIEDFFKSKRSKNGYFSYCKVCHNTKRKERVKDRYKHDANLKIVKCLRNRLRSVLNGAKKSSSSIDLLGCDIDYFKKWIEYQFDDWMSWDNHGEWHIDHIKTVISFDKETHPSIVNALSNLRPLWATTREINGIIYDGNLNR